MACCSALQEQSCLVVQQQFLGKHSDLRIGRVSVHDQFVQTDADHECKKAGDHYRGEADMSLSKR